MKKAALYIRVSTSMQADEGLSIPAQLKLLKEYAVNNSYTISEDHIFIDAGESAKTADRPQFQLMIAMAKQKPRPFDAVLVHKTDRFARNRLDSAVYKSLLRKECGIDVVSITENFGDDPYGVMMEGIMELFAEFYSLNLSAEVRKGMTEAAGSGIALGRVPYGYVIDPDTNKYIIAEDEAEVVRFIFHMYVELGYGMDKIYTYLASKTAEHKFGEVIRTQTSKAQKKLHLIGKTSKRKWSSNTIRHILQNDAYIGVYRWKPQNGEEVVIPHNHPPIISKATFNEAQELMARRRSRRRGVQQEYMLRGLVKCAYCGRSMVIFSTKRKNKYYRYIRCSNKNQDSYCHKNGMPLHILEQLILDKLANPELSDKLNIVTKAKSANKKTVQRLKALLESFDSKFDRQMEAFQSGIINIEQLKKYKEKLEKEKQELELELKKAEMDAGKVQVDKTELLNRISNVVSQLKAENKTEYEKQRALASLVDKITVDKFNKKIEIFYKFD